MAGNASGGTMVKNQMLVSFVDLIPLEYFHFQIKQNTKGKGKHQVMPSKTAILDTVAEESMHIFKRNTKAVR